ncbi:MAG TPA: hypothetical protein VL181_02075 [Holophagaceae bacterium]|nr:hypothetical protein [Holophagaceae bacterium]
MNRLLRVLMAAVFVTAGWVHAPMPARPCCPCAPVPGCCPLTAPSAHALPAQGPRLKARKAAQVPASPSFIAAAPEDGWDASVLQPVHGLAAKQRRAWLRVWRI